jgi:cobalt-precorrin-5B (C1)-methyltransferase
MEIIAAAAAKEGAGTELILGILDCLTTEEAFAKLREADSAMAERTAVRLMEGILASLNKRAGGGLRIECIMYTKENGLIAASDGAEAMIRDNREQWNG